MSVLKGPTLFANNIYPSAFLYARDQRIPVLITFNNRGFGAKTH
jgi:hypothetical protein